MLDGQESSLDSSFAHCAGSLERRCNKTLNKNITTIASSAETTLGTEVMRHDYGGFSFGVLVCHVCRRKK